MESDDERARPDAFATMIDQLRATDAGGRWDAVSCAIELVGWERPGMQRYADWQNSLRTAAAMAAERFVEIPCRRIPLVLQLCIP